MTYVVKLKLKKKNVPHPTSFSLCEKDLFFFFSFQFWKLERLDDMSWINISGWFFFLKMVLAGGWLRDYLKTFLHSKPLVMLFCWRPNKCLLDCLPLLFLFSNVTARRVSESPLHSFPVPSFSVCLFGNAALFSLLGHYFICLSHSCPQPSQVHL